MKKIILQIEGMTCSACSLGLEKYLKKQPGIIDSNVNLILSIATITYQNIKIKDIENYIKKAGFTSLGEFRSIETKFDNSKKRNILIIMGIILIMQMFIMLLHMHKLLNINNPIYYSTLMFLLTITFIIYGIDILKSGLKNLNNKIPNMDSLIFLSTTSSFLYSIYFYISILNGNYNSINNLYFESICMIIYFVKLGRYIENKSRDKTKEAISKLVRITPKSAILKVGNKEKKVSIDEIKHDDIIICKAGDKIAADGEIITGKTHVDESFITGESTPVSKIVGDRVIAGSINYEGYIEYAAKKIGKESTISSIVKLVVEATNTKNKTQKLVDKISSIFIPSIIAIAILTFIIQLLLGYQAKEAFSHLVTILVVACPCALGLAIPLVMVVATGVCASHNLFIRNSEVLENIKDINTVIFDKTGTLTYGKLNIFKLYNYSTYNDENLLNIVANIENLSTHPISRAFSITSNLEVSDFKNIPGLGIHAKLKDKTYYLGNQKLLKELNIKELHDKDYNDLTNSICSIIYVVENNKVIALIGVKDTIRKNSKEIITNLKKLNIKTMMLTGDNEKIASSIAKELNIDKYLFDILPEEKANIVKELTSTGNKVIMVGDGINDAPALVNATIAISINDGTDIAMDSSSVILMNNNLNNILALINIGKYSYKIMKQNLFWAFFYNICMLPIAMGLFEGVGIKLVPMFGSIAMTISSILVVINSLRINKLKRE